ncbi:LacI family transcriptional regulator [Microlunatus elymi]|uniref:LacI family transcriptional regulator n=1 Tax=Microlunatus elymi TaxID=2596828 RepID=A0A516PVX0_9ACTN|nr:LacI family DNA-binding transcriptional regulator [Microlunatus elymi]QDP95272.1 LacI family transcriptional regulator [Microlunatus elymi]
MTAPGERSDRIDGAIYHAPMTVDRVSDVTGGVAQPLARQRPRLKDVAVATGLSIKTVSRALRGESNVAESTRQLVQTEADRLGVQLNDVAAGLRRKTQAMTSIGVMLGDFANPFFAPMLKGIDAVAAEHGYLVLTADAQNDGDIERRAIRSFLAHRVAGLIIAPSGDDLSYLANEVAYGSAVVFVDSPPLGLEGATDSVTTTNFASTKLGVEHLIQRGHRRIGYLGHPRGGSGANGRWSGYRAALREAGMKVDRSLVRHGLYTESDATAAADRIMRAEPDAVVVDNNRLCTGLLQSRLFAEHRPEVLGFDRFSLAAEFGITVIDSNPYEVGRAGARLLFERLADPFRPPRHIEVPATLTVNDRAIY